MTITTESPTKQRSRMTRLASRSQLRSIITVHAAPHPEFDVILSPAALDFVGDLHRCFAGRRAELLEARREEEARTLRVPPRDRSRTFGPDLADRATGPWLGGSPLRDHRPPRRRP